jgi:small redox-active disulfide protein 2
MLIVKILGTGCANCKRLEQDVREALTKNGIAHQVVKVTEYADIMAYNILSTPGLVMNETVVSAGRIPSQQQIVAWAKQYSTDAPSEQ